MYRRFYALAHHYTHYGLLCIFLASKQTKNSFSQAMWSSWIRRNQHCVQIFPVTTVDFLIIVAVKTVDLWCLYFTNVHLPGLFSAIFIFRNMERIMQSSVYIIYLLDFSVFWISWLKLANSAIVWNVHIVTRFLHLFIFCIYFVKSKSYYTVFETQNSAVKAP